MSVESPRFYECGWTVIADSCAVLEDLLVKFVMPDADLSHWCGGLQQWFGKDLRRESLCCQATRRRPPQLHTLLLLFVAGFFLVALLRSCFWFLCLSVFLCFCFLSLCRFSVFFSFFFLVSGLFLFFFFALFFLWCRTTACRSGTPVRALLSCFRTSPRLLPTIEFHLSALPH